MTEREQALAGLEGFATWADVLTHISAGGRVHYHAPMSYLPAFVKSATVEGDGVIIGAQYGTCKFTADAGHLSRFLRRKVPR